MNRDKGSGSEWREAGEEGTDGAALPVAQSTPARGANAPENRAEQQAGQVLDGFDLIDRNLVPLTSPHSAAAEQYRMLFHRLRHSAGEIAPRVLTVTSAMGGEGKSLTAANLALIAASERGSTERILLIDADLRRPSLHALFGVPLSPGLAEVASGHCALEQALRPLGIAGLSLLSAGGGGEERGGTGRRARSRGARSARAAMSSTPHAALGNVLARLRAAFDAIYLDVPPLLASADGAFWASESDGTLLVVRAGETSRQMVAQALEALGEARLLGCVLNAVEARRSCHRA
ncbi:MAG: CpsD/CapB family tyrosine-protein kinase [Myxococcales bacterium]|jgi:non-specific protein-tyrosine kinase|nr:CpsD/CapB family tyrosine-protein kinase [Myxococcales bacterium]